MDEISQQLLCQRIRNRVIEVMEFHSTVECMAMFGAFELVEIVDDWLLLTCEDAPGVFSAQEREVISEFLMRAGPASAVAEVDTWDVEWFKASPEWSALSEIARKAYAVFMQ